MAWIPCLFTPRLFHTQRIDSFLFFSPSENEKIISELQVNKAINIKAQLVFHMIESMIGGYTLQKIYAKILEDVTHFLDFYRGAAEKLKKIGCE